MEREPEPVHEPEGQALRAPVGQAMTVGGEVRWQKAEGDTNAAETGLLDDKIDLGGWTTSFTFHFRF